MGRPKRVLQKAIAVIGEGYTEREYFDYVRVTRQFKFHFKPDLCKPSNYRDIFDKAKKLKEENYDLVHSEGPRGEHTTSIGGERKNLTGKDILKVAKATGIKKETALNIIDKMSSLEFPRETI
jgi:coenzyme F420-reducing hydrogenase alpha subunit